MWVRAKVGRLLIRFTDTPIRRALFIGILLMLASMAADFVSAQLTGKWKFGAYMGNVLLGALGGYTQYRIEHHRSIIERIDNLRKMIIMGRVNTVDQIEKMVNEVLRRAGFDV
jgi:hypothetical protein